MHGISPVTVNAGVVETVSATKSEQYALGSVVGCYSGGRYGLFRYGRNHMGSALAAGDALMPADRSTANFRQNANTYTALGISGHPELVLNQAVPAEAVVADQYVGCMVAIMSEATQVAAQCQIARIIGNEAATTATGQRLKLYLDHAFATAPVVGSDIQILTSDFLIKTQDAYSTLSGFALGAVADDYYFWRQVSGLVFVKEETAAAFTAVTNSPLVLVGGAADGSLIIGANTVDLGDAALAGVEMLAKVGTTASDLALCSVHLPLQIYGL